MTKTKKEAVTPKPTHTPGPQPGDDYTEADYFAEMGFSLEDRIEAQRRRDALYDAEPAPLPCGCLSHENGGPADYGQECRQ